MEQKQRKIKSEKLKTFVNECLLSVKDIAVLLSLSERTVYRLIAAGKINGSVKIGRSVRYPSSVLNELIKRLKGGK